MTEKTINMRLNKIQKLKEEKAQIENKIKELEDTIKELMGDEIEEIETDMYNIKWTKYIEQQFDKKRFETENNAIYKTYLKPVDRRRFSFTKKKGINVA
jgi:predicted phage-related endonuclease